MTSRPACDVEARDVADDDTLGDLAFTVADLVTAAAGASVVDLRDATGATHATTVEAVRGDEPATFLDATATSTETTRFGFGGDTSLIDVRCEDSVEVPMWLRVESADGAVASAPITRARWVCAQRAVRARLARELIRGETRTGEP